MAWEDKFSFCERKNLFAIFACVGSSAQFSYIFVSVSLMLLISDWIGDVAPRVSAVLPCESFAQHRHGLLLLEIAFLMDPAQFEFVRSLI